MTVIDMNPRHATCCVCGVETLSKWGVPIGVDGEWCALIVSNDYQGDWCGKPACPPCYQKHQAGELTGHDPAY